MRLLPALVLLSTCWAAAGTATAADTPSGIVEQVSDGPDGGLVVMRFDAQAASSLVPGEMVALYAPGAVEKHPLTGQVITSRPVLAAKLQLTEVVGRIAGKVRWVAPKATVTVGMDAIPLPKEAAPNAAPALTAPAPKLSAVEGSAVVIQLPVVDNDKDPLATIWMVEGPAGRTGRLLARTTGGVATTWIAPLPSGQPPAELTAVAKVRDPLGQEAEVRVPLSTTPLTSVTGRALKPLARWGLGQEPALLRLERDTAGTWWGLSSEGLPIRISAGWLTEEPLALPQDQQPKNGVALAVRGDELHVLDAGKRQVVVYGTDSTVRRTYGHFDHPTDLALAADGTAFIADQSAGGIEIIEPDGRYRGRLGRAGSGDDSWQGLVAVTLDRAGTLYALDATQHQVVLYDRFQRRLAAWAVPADPNDPPVDLAVHPIRGLLVLFASGKLVAVSSSAAVDAAKPESSTGLEPGKAVSLVIDQLGDVVTCHPGAAALVRYDPTLVCTGMRMERGLYQTLWAADGSGNAYGLDQGTGMVTVFDNEGWAVNRVDADAKGGGMFGATLDLSVDPGGARLWVSDSKKYGAHRVELGKVAVGSVVGGEGGNNGQFSEPVAVTCDEAGRVYVLDADQYRVQVFDAKGTFLFTFGQRGKGGSEFNDPQRIAVSPAGDACYVYDAWSYEVKKFAVDQEQKSAKHVTNGGGKGTGTGQFKKVASLGCDRLGLLYALDTSREDVQVFDFRGNSCVTIASPTLIELDMPMATALATTPDGQVGLMGGGRVTWFRW